MDRVTGLQNLGNTCYLNTSLQCLFRCDDFVQLILKTHPRLAPHPLLLNLKNLILNMNVHKVVSPHTVLRVIEATAIKSQHQQFSQMRCQHDMSEFIIYLLDLLHINTERKVTIKIAGKPNNEIAKQTIDAMSTFKDFFENHYSDLIPLFFGQYQSCTHNLSDNTFSYSYDPFSTIQLEIPPSYGKKLHLSDCFNFMVKSESIQLQKTTIHRTTKFWKFPKYIIIVLGRFSATGKKRNENIEIPQTLDLRQYTNGPEQYLSKFSLISVGNHRGSVAGGHYYAYVKDRKSQKWFVCNDNTIRPMNSTQSISSPFAYCLLYVKFNTEDDEACLVR